MPPPGEWSGMVLQWIEMAYAPVYYVVGQYPAAPIGLSFLFFLALFAAANVEGRGRILWIIVSLYCLGGALMLPKMGGARFDTGGSEGLVIRHRR